jgi:Predicted membrane protein
MVMSIAMQMNKFDIPKKIFRVLMQNSQMETPLPPELPVMNSPSLFGETEQADVLGRNYHFRFKGNASEYFGIWIVNILLTIVTLGLYAPWAKVRRLRYFYGNTWVFQRRFDFTGLPTKILVGRIIALVVYGGFSFAAKYSWEAFLAGFVLIFLQFLGSFDLRFVSVLATVSLVIADSFFQGQ